MSRERFVDPRIWHSEQFMQLPLEARLLFIGMITTADDHGRRTAGALTLKVDIFPLDDASPADVLGWRDQIEAAGLIKLYQGEDETPLLWLPKWGNYQHPKYIARSKLPAYDSDSAPLSPVPAEPSPVSPPGAKPAEGWGVVGCGGEGSEKTGSPPTSEAHPAQAQEIKAPSRVTPPRKRQPPKQRGEAPHTGDPPKSASKQKRIDVVVVNAVMEHWLDKIVPQQYPKVHSNSGAVRAQVTAAYRALKADDTEVSKLSLQETLDLFYQRALTLKPYWHDQFTFGMSWCKYENLSKFLNGDWSERGRHKLTPEQLEAL